MSIKRLIRKIGFTGITLNIGFIGLNFAGGSSKVNSISFTQNNYSPKALSRSEIYRDTSNQFSMLKEAVFAK